MIAEYGGLQSTGEGGVNYILQDNQGSTRAITSASGTVQSRMDYQAFGEQIQTNVGQRTAQGYASSDNLRQKYALTERDDATGLDHTLFRKHENEAGRWTSPDPYNGSASIGNPQSFNRYSYVENQPTNFVDPSGLDEGDDDSPIRIYTSTWHWYDALLSLYLGGLERQMAMPVYSNPGGGGETVGGDETLPCPERDKELSLSAHLALELYIDGKGRPVHISIGEIMAGFPAPPAFPSISKLISQGTHGKSMISHDISMKQTDLSGIQTGGWQGAVLGRITFNLSGQLNVYNDGYIQFAGSIGVNEDIYDFDASNRGKLGEFSTAVGRHLPGKPYKIITEGRYQVFYERGPEGTTKSSCK